MRMANGVALSLTGEDVELCQITKASWQADQTSAWTIGYLLLTSDTCLP